MSYKPEDVLPGLLGRMMSQGAERTVVRIPTCVDPSRYPVARHNRAGAGVQLVWVGSTSTLKGLQAVSQHILAGQDGEHAGGGARGGGVDPPDQRMRMRRAHHHRIDLIRQVQIVAVPPSPG